MTDTPFKHRTVLQFAKLLPGVDRDGFRAMFEDPLEMFLVSKGVGIRVLERKTIKGQTLAMADMEGLEKRKRVDARAAGTILRLYSAGALPMLKGQSRGPAPLVEQYVANAATAERQEEEHLKRTAADWKNHVDHPATVPESAFGLRLLNEIFLSHLGPGGGTLDIGGIIVTKTAPQRHVSNSRKSSDWSYHFVWRSSDGSDQRLSRESSHAGNRRTDPDRNWGLGRE